MALKNANDFCPRPPLGHVFLLQVLCGGGNSSDAYHLHRGQPRGLQLLAGHLSVYVDPDPALNLQTPEKQDHFNLDF
jgi:hypothetical protein